MEAIFWASVCTLVAILCIHILTKERLARYPTLLEASHFLVRSAVGFFIWFIMTLITAAALKSVFPDQSLNIQSGSLILIIPAFAWACLIGWVVTGKRTGAEGDGPLATVEGRLDALHEMPGAIISGMLRFAGYGAIIAIAVCVLILAIIVGNEVEDKLTQMSPSKAIILGAIIIALVIHNGFSRRNK